MNVVFNDKSEIMIRESGWDQNTWSIDIHTDQGIVSVQRNGDKLRVCTSVEDLEVSHDAYN